MKTILFITLLLFGIIMSIIYIDIVRSLIKHETYSYFLGLKCDWIDSFLILILIYGSILGINKLKHD